MNKWLAKEIARDDSHNAVEHEINETGGFRESKANYS